MAELPVGTLTFLFTDIEGSTQLLKQLRDAYGEVLGEHQRLLREASASAGGQEIDTQSDAFFFAFRRARDAVAAAAAGQRTLAEHEWPEGASVRVRMGLHTGEPAAAGERYVGMGVHRAARICAAAHGGQILLSNATRELIEDELPEGVELRDLGEQRLKDVDRPERLFADPAKKKALAASLDRRVMAQGPWVPLWTPKLVDFTARRVANYQYNTYLFPLLDQLWVK